MRYTYTRAFTKMCTKKAPIPSGNGQNNNDSKILLISGKTPKDLMSKNEFPLKYFISTTIYFFLKLFRVSGNFVLTYELIYILIE